MNETVAQAARRLAKDYLSGPGFMRWKDDVIKAVTRAAAVGRFSVEVPPMDTDEALEWLRAEGLRIGFVSHFNGETTIQLLWDEGTP